MKMIKKAGLATAALAVAACISPADAADLNGGSIKDNAVRVQPPTQYNAPRGPAGNCYFRGDLGYSVSRAPSMSWSVANGGWTYDATKAIADADALNGAPTGATFNKATNTLTFPGIPPAGFNANSATYWNQTSTYIGDSVTDTKMDNAWFGGAGIGCGMGSWGLRGEAMLGYTGHRNIQGQPLFYNPAGAQPTVVVAPNPAVAYTPPANYTDPLHTGVKSTTLMVNAYKDLGNFGGVVPYLGAGVGVSYNQLGEVYFTGNPNLTNRIEGDSRLSMAWALMAGIGWQVTDRAILDFGYRYMDYGKAQSGRVDSAGFLNPRVQISDLSAHEFKVGLRYHFGGSDCCAQPSYQPMK